MVKTRTKELTIAYKEIEGKEELLRILIETIPSPIFYKDNEFRYLGCNTAFEKLIGKNKEEIVGKSVFEIFREELAGKYNEKDVELLNKPPLQSYESKIADASGQIRDAVFNKAVYFLDNKMIGIVGVIEDITEIKKMQVMLKELTMKDSLTELYNGRGIDELAKMLFRYSMRHNSILAVLLIEIDDMKLFDDKFQYESCLSSVANSVKENCFRPLDIVGRYKEDKILVVLPDTDKFGAVEVAERIEKNIRRLKNGDSENIEKEGVTVSIGVYTNIPEKNDDIKLFVEKADEKLTIAKKFGKGIIEI